MARFKTIIPTEVNDFIKTLPKRASLEMVMLNPDTNELYVLWSDEDIFTGLTVPMDYPLESFKKGRLPQKACKASDRPKAPVPLPTKQNVPQVKQEPKKAAPVYLDEAGLTEAVAKGTQIEYQGVLPRWIAFNPKVDKYTEGFFYRPMQQTKQPQPA